MHKKFSFKQKNKWVIERSWNDTQEPLTYKLLYDRQFSELGEEHEEYIRWVEKAINSTVLEEIAQVNLIFNPSFEHLCVHHIRVFRNDTLIWQAQEEDFEIFRRERNIEKRIYDGCYTANLIIPNFQTNDILDVAYTRIGSHPVAKSFIDTTIVFNYGIKEQKMHYRLLLKNATELNFYKINNPIEPIITEYSDYKEYYWKVEDTKIIESEYNSPPSYYSNDFIFVATKAEWSDIADIFRENYILNDEIPNELIEILNDLKLRYKYNKQLCLETIKYVQNSIRYLAISIGEAGFIPRRLTDIWNTKYGDCKEKSLLLVYCLKYLGFDAAPALVNTSTKEELSKIIPRLYAFNHCIVRVKINDEISYFDPTTTDQEGNWECFMRPYFSNALPLIENATIEAIPINKGLTEIEAYEVWDFEHSKTGVQVKFHIKTFWRDYMAINLRTDLTRKSKEAISNNYKEYYENKYGPLKNTQETSFIENKDKDEFEINEYYEFEKPLKYSSDHSKTQFFWNPEEYLPDFIIDTDKTRVSPFYLGFERHKHREAIFNMAWPHSIDGFILNIKEEKWQASYFWEVPKPNQLIVKHDFKCSGGVIEVDQLANFIKQVEKCRQNNGVGFLIPSHSNKFLNYLQTNWPILIPTFIFLTIYFLYGR